MKQSDLYDPKERERLLRHYQGIFKSNIKEFAETIVKPAKKIKNMAR